MARMHQMILSQEIGGLGGRDIQTPSFGVCTSHITCCKGADNGKKIQIFKVHIPICSTKTAWDEPMCTQEIPVPKIYHF